MAEENINVYLTHIQKLIKSGNPKYMSYISKEYMKYVGSSSIITETIESMVHKVVNSNPKSPYAVFLDNDGTISLETIDDISKISNVEEFTSQVQELSKYGIDFQDLSSEDLIIEGSEMAEELAKEVENAENLTEKEQEELKDKASGTLTKLTGLALIGGTIGAMAKGLLSKISAGLAKLSGKKSKDEKDKETSDEEKERLERIARGKKNMQSEKTFDDVCPRQDVNEEEVLKDVKIAQTEREEQAAKKKSDTYGDGDPDGDDLDI